MHNIPFNQGVELIPPYSRPKHVAPKMPSARWAQIKLLPKNTAHWFHTGGTYTNLEKRKLREQGTSNAGIVRAL